MSGTAIFALSSVGVLIVTLLWVFAGYIWYGFRVAVRWCISLAPLKPFYEGAPDNVATNVGSVFLFVGVISALSGCALAEEGYNYGTQVAHVGGGLCALAIPIGYLSYSLTKWRLKRKDRVHLPRARSL